MHSLSLGLQLSYTLSFCLSLSLRIRRKLLSSFFLLFSQLPPTQAAIVLELCLDFGKISKGKGLIHSFILIHAVVGQ